jgi:hypothetical protein
MTQNRVYTGISGKFATLREIVPYVKLHPYIETYSSSKLNGYGDNDVKQTWSPCGSKYYT